MQLDRTKSLVHQGANLADPRRGLIHVLESAMELVSIPDNDFVWSSWTDASQAKAEIQSLIGQVESGSLPSKVKVSVLFAPTGPLQELSLGSGWADSFLKVAERFDEVEARVWPSHG
jgi:hypothetical protein